MKLQAIYWKDARGCIKATIRVLEAGDYPETDIFPRELEDPGRDGWKLGEGAENAISYTLPSAYDAKKWVSEQIDNLKGKLDYWRAIVVPEPEEFEV
jgi:hypothetical protein